MTLKLLAFLAALLIGIAAVGFLFRGNESKLQDSIETPHPPLMAANQVLPREKNIQTFVPEFTGLPNMGGEITPNGKLIDLWVEDGLYRQRDVVAKNGESWFVLTKKRGKYLLERSVAHVKKLNTGSWPGDENDAKLTFKTSGDSILALRNISSISSGAIPTLYQQSMHEEDSTVESLGSEEISDGYRREFVLSENRYILRTAQGLTKDRKQVAVLVIEFGDKKQVLKSTYHVGEEDRDIIGSLLWVGDMDRDGKLDLYLDEFNEKGFTRTDLFLSSKAEKNSLVRLVATFGMPGC